MTRKLTVLTLAHILFLAACEHPTGPMNASLDGLDETTDLDGPVTSNAVGTLAGEMPLIGPFETAQAEFAVLETWDGTTWIYLAAGPNELAILNVTFDEADLVVGSPTAVPADGAIATVGDEPWVHYVDHTMDVEALTVLKDTDELGIVYTLMVDLPNGYHLGATMRLAD